MLQLFASLTPELQERALAEATQGSGLDSDVLKSLLLEHWGVVGRPKQQPPSGGWTYWFLRCGRGFGKTLSVAQWARERALERTVRFALVAPTFGDARDTMVEGEALALDTLLPTPDGYTTMGDLKDGDVVLGGNGEPCRVVHAHPVLHDRDCYRVRLKGGIEIVADGRHRWLTEDYACRAYSARHGTTGRHAEVVTTAEMRETLRHPSGQKSQANHGIRVAAVEAPDDVNVSIDPYVLGAWLGDGLTKAGAICDAEGEVIAEVADAGYTVRRQPSSSTVSVYGVLGLQAQLRAAGLLNNKHVPVNYLRASPRQRLALVQGLMDTDGYVSKRGQCEFVSARRDLADAIVDLLCGLGVKASAPREKLTRLGTTHWLVKFTTTIPVFRMRRKAGRLPARYRDAAHWYVQAIEPTESVPVRCITVDSPDSTYLVTRHFVRTHNTGLLSVLRPSELLGGSRERAWNRSLGELRLANGSLFKAFSSEKPDRIRGPQHHYAWCEEISSWKDAHKGDTLETTWSNVKLSTRLGEPGADPQIAVTSTPKNNKLTRELVKIPAPRMRMVIGSSYENRVNLPQSWWDEVIAPYEGTRTGRQEIMAELLEDVEGALWTRALLDDLRVDVAPALAMVVVAVDPNASSSEASNEAGIIVCGRDRQPLPKAHGYVLADRTPDHGGPAVWAQAAVDAYHEYEADTIVAEKNNGGEMVQLVIQGVDPNVPVKLVSASRGKRTRAEPVAALYTGSKASDGTVIVPGRVHHVMGDGEAFDELEDQQVTWTPESESPDRMDALVWGMTELLITGPGPIKMRTHRTRRRLPTPGDRFADAYPPGSGPPTAVHSA